MATQETYRPLVPDDFTFHGFDELMTPLADTLHDIGIRRGPPAASTVEDAVFVPARKVPAVERTPGRLVHEGGLVNRDGRPIELAQSRRRGTRWGTRVLGDFSQPVAVHPKRRLDEDIVYLGWYFDHFGHFLMESLARTWFLSEIPPSVKVAFHTKRNRPAGITQQILEAFGIPPERIVWLEEPTLLRRVIVPEPLYELSCSAHEWMPRSFRSVAARYISNGQPFEQPVYLSRRLLPSYLRQIVGEFELEEILRENGFLIAYPETMTFPDQVRLFNQHTDFFTSAGSAAYNILFALHGPTLHVLTCGIPRQDYFLAPAVAGAPSAYCNGFGRGGRPSINTTPVLADLPTIADYLETSGFLRKRLRSRLASQAVGLQERFDEAWLYASVRDVPTGETLASEIEQEASALARTSWPVAWMLAQHHSLRDASLVADLARQFIALVATERDMSRLAQHRRDIEAAATKITRACDVATAAQLRATLAHRFLVDVASGQKQRDRVPAAAISASSG